MDVEGAGDEITLSEKERTLASFVSGLSCSYESGRGAQHASNLKECFSSTAKDKCSCHVSCLSLKRVAPQRGTVQSKACLKQLASQRLCAPLIVGTANIVEAPPQLLRNVSSSFQWMLNKQIESTCQRLAIRSRVFSQECFKVQNKGVRITQASTNFACLAAALVGKHAKAGKTCLSLPITFQCTFEVSLMDNLRIPISVQVPGKVVGVFMSDKDGLEFVKIAVNTSSLLDKMLTKCRVITQKLSTVLLKRASAENGTVNCVFIGLEQGLTRSPIVAPLEINNNEETPQLVLVSPQLAEHRREAIEIKDSLSLAFRETLSLSQQ